MIDKSSFLKVDLIKYISLFVEVNSIYLSCEHADRFYSSFPYQIPPTHRFNLVNYYWNKIMIRRIIIGEERRRTIGRSINRGRLGALRPPCFWKFCVFWSTKLKNCVFRGILVPNLYERRRYAPCLRDRLTLLIIWYVVLLIFIS
jgi:hypothetical protein